MRFLTANAGRAGTEYSNAGNRPGFGTTGMFSHSIVADLATWTALDRVGRATSPIWGEWAAKKVEQKGLASWALRNTFSKKLIDKAVAGEEVKVGKSFVGRGLERIFKKDVAGQFWGWMGKSEVATAGGLGVKGALGVASTAMNVLLSVQMAAMVPTIAAGAVGFLAEYGVSEKRKHIQRLGSDMYGKGFPDSRAAATMRQTAISQIQGSQMGVMRALSREASFMHR